MFGLFDKDGDLIGCGDFDSLSQQQEEGQTIVDLDEAGIDLSQMAFENGMGCLRDDTAELD